MKSYGQNSEDGKSKASSCVFLDEAHGSEPNNPFHCLQLKIVVDNVDQTTTNECSENLSCSASSSNLMGWHSIPKRILADDYLFKIVLIGDSAVGKSNLLARFARDEFYPNSKSTIGVEFQTQKVEIKGKEIKAQIWDTAGQERFRAVTSAYYRGAVGALLVYDISRRQTFHSIGRWLNELHTNSDMNVVAILVGNKSDLNEAREVSTEEGKLLAESEGLFFMETSALDSSNVTAAFETVVKEIYNILSRKVMESQKHEPSLSGNGKTVVLEADSDKDNVPNKTWCCSS
ncbi:hypothetical protein R6Q59_001894 [Mikania micrantha]